MRHRPGFRVPLSLSLVVLLQHGVCRYYKGRYGGYAGEASAEKVFDLLTDDDNIFLVDIRPEEQREKEGLPELKLGARYKVAAFPVQVCHHRNKCMSCRQQRFGGDVGTSKQAYCRQQVFEDDAGTCISVESALFPKNTSG